MKALRIRKWLNRTGHHSSAFVFVNIGGEDGDGTLRIADCSRQVDLAVDWYNKGQWSNTLHKLDVLTTALEQTYYHILEYGEEKGWKL